VAGHPAAGASTGSIAQTLILILALVTLALGGFAATIRWKRRTAAA
jgi:LPXTG-motif cell wall-anchored protein